MPNFEAAKRRRIGHGRFAMLLNMSPQLALQDRFKKGAHFFFVAGRLQFHATIAEIANETGHVKTLRDVPDRPAKANALDIAFVKHLHGCAHASED